MIKKVSIILPSYNHEKYLSECIESILNQSYLNYELIIVDDASSDKSQKIIKKYAVLDNRIKYIFFKENRGTCITVKQGYNISEGEYIAAASSDDVWYRDKLKNQVAYLENNKKIGAVFGVPDFIDENGNELSGLKNQFKNSTKYRNKYEWMNYFFNKGNCICHPTMLIRRECHEKIGLYNPVYRSLLDLEMWIRLFFNYDVRVLPEKCIKYRVHPTNESGSNISNFIRVDNEMKFVLKSFLNQINSLEDLVNIFPEYKGVFKVKNDILIPFYLAQIALKVKNVAFSSFALDILYSEMQKDDVLNLLMENNLYDVVQLSKDVVNLDIYNRNAIEKKKTFIKIPFIIKMEEIKKTSCKIFILNFLGFNIIKRIKEKNKKKLFICGFKIYEN